jgi:phospholipase/lecithinase/hemolysin
LLAAAGARNVVRVASDSRWGSRYYKDDIHPTPEGNRVLAAILASQID